MKLEPKVKLVNVEIKEAAMVRVIGFKEDHMGETLVLLEHHVLDEEPDRIWCSVGDVLVSNLFLKATE